MSGIQTQEVNELIANAGQPTPRALTVQGAGANAGFDQSMSYQSELLGQMMLQTKWLMMIARQLENMTGERYSLEDFDPTIQ